MPNLAMAEDSMCAALQAAMAGQPATVLWPNVDPPLPHPREGQDSWCDFHILHDGSDQHTLGAPGERTFTRTGTATLQVFVPAGQRGLSAASSLAMAAASAFEGRTVDGVRFYRVGTKTVGRDGSWFQVNVHADFEFDEVR